VHLVIDAQIVANLYKELVLETAHACTESPNALFERLGGPDVAYLDESEMIESEWRRVAGSEWFEVWLAERFSNDEIRVVAAPTCPVLIKALRAECGFPGKSRDPWYIRTAKAVADRVNEVSGLITEDADFFDPKAKASAEQRAKVMAASTGPVAKRLAKEHVDVRTVAKHLA
jgi:hypothetical protein